MEFNTTQEIIDDIADGKLVILVDDEDRENEGDLVCAAELVTPEIINFMATKGRGLICLPLSSEKCDQLNLPMMTNHNRAKHTTAFTVSIEAKKGVTTGISAQDRSQTIKVAVSSHSKPSDLVSPGHIFPLLANDGGVLVRAGHTEAAVDLARMATNQKSPYGVICEIMNDDGTMARLKDLVKFCKKHKLKMSSIKDLIEYKVKKEKLVKCVRTENSKIKYLKDFKTFIYKNILDGTEHLALVKGKVSSTKNILVRMHSLNIYSDLLDPKNEILSKSIDIISKEENGIIVIIRNPKKELLDKDFHVKRKSILKEYGIGAQILTDLGAKKITLLTTSTKKIIGVDGFGLDINGKKKLL